MPFTSLDLPVAPGEVALTDGTLRVIVGIARDRGPGNEPVYSCSARAVDARGVVLSDPNGRPVITTWVHASSAAEIQQLGESGLLRELVLTMLGEPGGTDTVGQPLLPVSAELRRSVSVQLAAAAARTMRKPPDLAALFAAPDDAG